MRQLPMTAFNISGYFFKETPMTPVSIIIIAITAGTIFIVLCFVIAHIAAAKAGFNKPSERASFRDSYTKTLAQVFGGAALALTFAWTVIKDNQTSDKDSKTLAQSVISSANQQFVDAAKLMADTAVEARAAGNYSFEKVVAAYPDYAEPVTNTLLAFILGHQPESAKHVAGTKAVLVDQDVRAAVYVLGKMTVAPDNPLELRDYYLAGANFSASKGFRQADFLGATLYATNFTWADLADAQFNGAHLEDWSSYGTNDWDAHLQAARDPNDNWWNWERFRYIANFDHAHLEGAHFDNTSVSGASFRFGTLTKTTFINTDISRADFRDAVDVGSAVFDQACYGKDDPTKPPTKPFGLPDNIMNKLRTCS
jgi:uncharacterized protein YjbI with pentapeptide repeats